MLNRQLDGSLRPSIKGAQQPLPGIAEAVVQGGYPEPNTRCGARAQQWYRQYVNSLLQRDIHDLRFYHYRDKDQVEVDLVIEQGKRVWGVEVKKAVSIQPGDDAGLARLAAHACKAWAGGILLHSGSNCLPLSNVPQGLAVPLVGLWGEY